MRGKMPTCCLIEKTNKRWCLQPVTDRAHMDIYDPAGTPRHHYHDPPSQTMHRYLCRSGLDVYLPQPQPYRKNVRSQTRREAHARDVSGRTVRIFLDLLSTSVARLDRTRRRPNRMTRCFTASHPPVTLLINCMPAIVIHVPALINVSSPISPAKDRDCERARWLNSLQLNLAERVARRVSEKSERTELRRRASKWRRRRIMEGKGEANE